MKLTSKKALTLLPAVAWAASLLLVPATASAHCDSLDGPVVLTARTALDKADVTPILKWVRGSDEREIKEAFAKTLAVRKKGAEAKELADRYFFETLVRVHRAGEGAPYTGLKASVADAGPAVLGADKALDAGSVEALVKLVTRDVEDGIRSRFARARDLRQHSGHSVDAGREFVEAYVDYVHFVEGVHTAATRRGGHHGEAAAGDEDHAAHREKAKAAAPKRAEHHGH